MAESRVPPPSNPPDAAPVHRDLGRTRGAELGNPDAETARSGSPPRAAWQSVSLGAVRWARRWQSVVVCPPIQAGPTQN